MANNVREIAAKANVSVATVSRVINQAEHVSPETRRRVETVMEELGLKADTLVRSARVDTRSIGILVPDLNNDFFTEIIKGIEEIAAETGIGILICHTHEYDQEEIRYLRLLKELHVCGIIITPTSDDDDSINNEYLNLLSSMKIPIVLVDRDVKYSRLSGVFIDNERGAFEAVKLLLEEGHRHIAYIGGPLNTVPGRERKRGYLGAFAMMNLPVSEDIVFDGDFTMAFGEQAAAQILQKHPQVTAIFSANNLMTLGCLGALNKAGCRIPDHMALVGFDDIPILASLGVDITVIDRPMREMGRQAMKLMTKMINGKKKTAVKRIVLMPELIKRGSEKLNCGFKEACGFEETRKQKGV